MYLSRLDKSPYADLASPTVHFDLEPMFATEFSASLGMSKQPPLRVVSDLGGGGALAKIEKGRRIMKERKSEWSQADELPVRLDLSVDKTVSSVLTFTHGQFLLEDRATTSAREPIPLHIRMPGLEGSVDRAEPAHDDAVWTCCLQGQFA